MRVAIEGMGWITPLGADLGEISARIEAGERGEVRELKSVHSPRAHWCMAVPAGLTNAISRNPRLRRSSAISLFTASAGIAALENAGLTLSPALAERTALVYAIASGGVVYTRRFYEQIATQGANAASPLLFPETVYNAPASHLAALLGITGLTYTLVGDSSVGVSAMKFGADLLDTGAADHVVVIGGEEIDWVLCEAYHEWRLTRAAPDSEHGMLLAEGAAALLLGRSGTIELKKIEEGVPFFRQSEAGAAALAVAERLAEGGSAELVVGSANGTFIDNFEKAAITRFFPQARSVFPKASLGEALGAGALMQTIIAALAVKSGASQSAAVLTVGLNQQVAGLVLDAPMP